MPSRCYGLSSNLHSFRSLHCFTFCCASLLVHLSCFHLRHYCWRLFLCCFFMITAAMSPEEYASVLQTVSSSVPPFLQSDRTPLLPPIAWLAAFNGSLVCYQVFGEEKWICQTHRRIIYFWTFCVHMGNNTRTCTWMGYTVPLTLRPMPRW